MRDGGTGGRGLLGSAGGRRSGRGRAGGHRSRGGGRGLGYVPRAKAAAGGRAACTPRDRAGRLDRCGRGTVDGRPPGAGGCAVPRRRRDGCDQREHGGEDGTRVSTTLRHAISTTSGTSSGGSASVEIVIIVAARVSRPCLRRRLR